MISEVDHLAKARAAWGEGIPSWVEALARACNETSQSKVGQRLGVSASMISATLSNRYQGDKQRIERLCRHEFERAAIDCPILGEIAPIACRRWQAKAERLRTGNNQNARMFRACRACPQYQKDSK